MAGWMEQRGGIGKCYFSEVDLRIMEYIVVI